MIVFLKTKPDQDVAALYSFFWTTSWTYNKNYLKFQCKSKSYIAINVYQLTKASIQEPHLFCRFHILGWFCPPIPLFMSNSLKTTLYFFFSQFVFFFLNFPGIEYISSCLACHNKAGYGWNVWRFNYKTKMNNDICM